MMGQATDEAGNVWETDAQGNAVRLIRAANQPPADPRFQYEGPKAQADAATAANKAQASAYDDDLARSRLANDRISRNVSAATAPAEIEKARADAAKARAEADKLARGGTQSETERAGAISGYQSALALEGIIADLEAKYKAGPGSTKGISGALDYLPTAANQRFDRASNAARGIVGQALGFTGGQLNSAAEAEMNIGPYIPTAGDKDGTIEDAIQRLRDLQKQAKDRSVAILGGVPDQYGNISQPPQFSNQINNTAPRRVFSNPSNGPQHELVGFDTRTKTLPPDPQMKADADAYTRQWLADPNRSEDEYVTFTKDLWTRYGRADSLASDEQIRSGLRLYYTDPIKAGEEPETIGLQGEDVSTSGLDRFRSGLVANPVGAAVANFADMGSFGAAGLMTGDKLQDLNEQHPLGALVGQIGGAIGGTAAIGAAGRAAAGKLAPKLLGGAGKAQFGRNLATDVAYSGAYGANTGQDPLQSMALGAVGSVGGQALGSAFGRAVGGSRSSPTLARLREQGVVPTIGQIARSRAVDNGGRSFIAGVEDVIANNGAAGTFVNNARGRSLEQANLAAFNRVSGGRPISEIGVEGLEQLDSAKNAAYSDALDGVVMPADDSAFVSQMANARQAGDAIDASRSRGDYGYVVDNKLGPIMGNGPQITGKQMQDSLRLLQGQSRSYNKAANGLAPDPSAGGVADAFDQTGEAIMDLAGRYSPQTMPKLNEANSVYRGMKVLDDAADRGVNDGGLFTGAQLGSAIKKNTGQFEGRGLSKTSQSPLYQLQQDMQAVLPNKVPPTGVNAAPALALGGAALGGAGAITDNDYLKYAGLAALMTTPYTKGGQNTLAKIALDRPEAFRKAGELIRRRKGLFGSAAVPMAITAQQ